MQSKLWKYPLGIFWAQEQEHTNIRFIQVWSIWQHMGQITLLEKYHYLQSFPSWVRKGLQSGTCVKKTFPNLYIPTCSDSKQPDTEQREEKIKGFSISLWWKIYGNWRVRISVTQLIHPEQAIRRLISLLRYFGNRKAFIGGGGGGWLVAGGEEAVCFWGFFVLFFYWVSLLLIWLGMCFGRRVVQFFRFVFWFGLGLFFFFFYFLNY